MSQNLSISEIWTHVLLNFKLKVSDWQNFSFSGFRVGDHEVNLLNCYVYFLFYFLKIWNKDELLVTTKTFHFQTWRRRSRWRVGDHEAVGNSNRRQRSSVDRQCRQVEQVSKTVPTPIWAALFLSFWLLNHFRSVCANGFRVTLKKKFQLLTTYEL